MPNVWVSCGEDEDDDAEAAKVCPRCRGSGRSPLYNYVNCQDCHGTGRVPKYGRY